MEDLIDDIPGVEKALFVRLLVLFFPPPFVMYFLHIPVVVARTSQLRLHLRHRQDVHRLDPAPPNDIKSPPSHYMDCRRSLGSRRTRLLVHLNPAMPPGLVLLAPVHELGDLY